MFLVRGFFSLEWMIQWAKRLTDTIKNEASINSLDNPWSRRITISSTLLYLLELLTLYITTFPPLTPSARTWTSPAWRPHSCYSPRAPFAGSACCSTPATSTFPFPHWWECTAWSRFPFSNPFPRPLRCCCPLLKWTWVSMWKCCSGKGWCSCSLGLRLRCSWRARLSVGRMMQWSWSRGGFRSCVRLVVFVDGWSGRCPPWSSSGIPRSDAWGRWSSCSCPLHPTSLHPKV